jgi:hypothetical protein
MTEQLIWDSTNNQFIFMTNSAVAAGGAGSNAPEIHVSADGITWTTHTIDNWPAGWVEARAIATNGSRIVVYMYDTDLADNSNDVLYSDDNGVTWTYTADAMGAGALSVPWVSAIYDGTQFVVLGDEGEVYWSTDGISSYSNDTIGSTSATDLVYDSNNSIYVACAPDASGECYSSSDRATWTKRSWTGNTMYHAHVVVAGTTVLTGDGGSAASSTNGTSWTAINANTSDQWKTLGAAFVQLYGTGYYSSKNVFFGAHQNGASPNNQPYINGYNTTATVSWSFGDFAPVSSLYRANAFSVLHTYLVLMSTREYDSGWTFHPRRIRWSAPGDVSDFSGTGSGTADLEGSGVILDSRAVNNRIITFETNVIGALSPRGYTDDPWEYEVISEGTRTLSNPEVVGDVCFFIAQDGLLWSTNGVTCQESGSSFDLTKFDDFDETKPIWLSYSSKSNSLYAFREESPYTVFVINLNDGTVASFVLPTVTSSNLVPRSLISIIGSNSDDVIAGYLPDPGNTSRVSMGQLSFGDAITGQDGMTRTASEDEYWYATAETGEIYIVPEGQKTSIKHILSRTYCDGTAGTNPHLLVDVKSIEESSWSNRGDNTGTTTVSTTACTGSGTAWSNTIGRAGVEVDGVETAFTCPAPPARVYLDTTLQVEDTDYTVSGNVVTFLTAPANTKTLYVYWDNFPEVTVAVDDFIETTEGLHRITAINTATNMTLDHYLSTGSDATATHHPAVQLPNGGGEINLGLNKLVEGAQIRCRIVPETGGDATVAKLIGLTVGHEPAGRKLVEATGS